MGRTKEAKDFGEIKGQKIEAREDASILVFEPGGPPLSCTCHGSGSLQRNRPLARPQTDQQAVHARAKSGQHSRGSESGGGTGATT